MPTRKILEYVVNPLEIQYSKLTILQFDQFLRNKLKENGFDLAKTIHREETFNSYLIKFWQEQE